MDSIQTNKNLNEIISAITELNSKILNEENAILSVENKSKYKVLASQFKTLSNKVFSKEENSIEQYANMEKLFDSVSSIAKFDFSQELEVSNNLNQLDYFSVSINLIRESIQDRVGEMLKQKSHLVSKLNTFIHVFNSFSELYLFTDNNGNIIDCNNTLKNNFHIEKETVLGINIKTFFETPSIQDNYLLDYTDTFANHYLEQDNRGNFKAKIVLRITGKFYNDENGKELGIIYKVEQMDNSIYYHPKEFSHSEVVTTIFNLVDKMTNQSAKCKQEELLNNITEIYTEKNDKLNRIESLILYSVNLLLSTKSN